MGLNSDDIDIALDNMHGEELAQKISDYLTEQNGKKVSYGVIKANAEKSKHLATAAIKVHGVFIDLVNLRADSYSEQSGIDRIGTPREDAFRRDFTVNSMFYNINTSQVEDWTEKGRQHLADKLIVTPLPAEVTFMDDPLRALRAIRFASRFGFDYGDDIRNAMKSQKVRVSH